MHLKTTNFQKDDGEQQLRMSQARFLMHLLLLNIFVTKKVLSQSLRKYRGLRTILFNAVSHERALMAWKSPCSIWHC